MEGMRLLSAAAEAIGGTTKKNEKVRILAEYLRARTVAEAAASAVFLSGRAFPAWEETTLQAGAALLWQVMKDITGKSDAALTAVYRKHGDLGTAAYDALGTVAPAESGLTVTDVARAFRDIAAVRGPAAKTTLIRELFLKATALEAKYLVKIMTGELRIGLKESLVEEAIALAYHVPSSEVQRADMLLGDIGETLQLAAAHRLNQARMRLFHPLGFMLASPVESAAEAFEYFHDAAVEDKYDGIRAQAHIGMLQAPGEKLPSRQVRLFSRTRDNITESFPELVAPLLDFPEDLILDGEIVAWRHGRALPFSELQKRLGRKTVTEKMMRQVPVCYVAFDVLYAGGELALDLPLRERHAMLDRIFAGASHQHRERIRDLQGKLEFEPAIEQDDHQHLAAVRAPVLHADSPDHLDQLFDAAQGRGNEGLMIKDFNSVYAPGRRGKSWLKLKRELATLDVVVTSVEWGHGKRAGVLSDYTFAVRDGERLVNVGKAYSGLTDKEIAEMTQWFLEHTIVDHGFWREVDPAIVLEVAFNAVMQSGRHDSGFALRFPRILRLRPDKSPADIDTIERVREIFERQKIAYPNAV
ncbi:MAG TPA: ATP-dependent DNA ligase [Terriglobales bacterium]|nr:ATP-dependent DNA ligase [Terriglobales bacterium]